MKHKAVKKKWDTLVMSFYSQYRQIFESLINTTSFYCLPFANKIDLKSLKVLILDGLHTTLKLLFLETFFKSHICSCNKLYFQFLLISADILSPSGLVSIIEFSKLPKIAEKIDKFLAKKAILYLNTCKSKFLLKQSILMRMTAFLR